MIALRVLAFITGALVILLTLILFGSTLAAWLG